MGPGPALLLLPLLGAPAPGPDPAPRARAGPEVELPEGRLAELFAELERRAPAPVAPPRPWPAWSDGSPDGWGGEAPWRDWVELLRAEAHAARPDPRRARLALLACAQERSAEAWVHLAAGGVDPVAASVLPRLFPGVPDGHLGSGEPLPAGVLLAPALPPPRDERLDPMRAGSLAALAGRSLRAPLVRVADTRFELRLVVEADGVQVDFVHVDGPPVAVRLRLPVPSGVALGRIYANWEPLGEDRFPIEVTVGPDPQRQTVWGRFRPRARRFPAPAPSAASGREGAELLVVVPARRIDEPRLARFAEALSELFGRPARLATPPDARGPRLFEPIAIHLGRDAESETDGDAELVRLIRTIEAHALAGAARR